MEKAAVISECGRYRYQLTRKWDNDLPEICFIMLNPSTADAEVDDPTIRRCINFAKSWSYGRLDVVNLFAYRATRPADLWAFDWALLGDTIGGMTNNDTLLAVAKSAQTVICAWGTDGSYRQRDAAVLGMLRRHGVELHALKLNKDGSPAHPLYLPAKLQPITLH